MLRTYGRDYRLILVGDATMGPYEIEQPGGSVEHWNEEAGAVWLARLCAAFPHLVWLIAEAAQHWDYSPSLRLTRTLLNERMYPLSVAGLDLAIRELQRPLGGAGRIRRPPGATSVTQEAPQPVP